MAKFHVGYSKFGPENFYILRINASFFFISFFLAVQNSLNQEWNQVPKFPKSP